MAERRLRIGLIGAGRRAQQHLATLRGLPELFELVAVCDTLEHVAQTVAQREGCAAFTDIRACLEKSSPDAVLIITPPESHHLAATVAAQHGVHMLVETPLAPTRRMMDGIGAAVDRAGVCLEVGENYGRRPADQLNRAAIRAGLIGKVLHLAAFNAPANDESCYHMISLFRAFADDDDVVDIRAFGHRVAGERAPFGTSGETWVDATLRFSRGISASLSYSTCWTHAVRWGRPRIVTVEGTEGYIVASEGSPDRLRRIVAEKPVDYAMQVKTQTVGRNEVPALFSYATSPEAEFVNPFGDRVLADVASAGVSDGLARALELHSLYRSVTRGASPRVGIAEARRSQELGILIAEAARSGGPVSAALTAETEWERDYHAALAARWGVDPFDDVDLVLGRAATSTGS